MSTQRYVAFLRGINVGGHRVEMAELRRLFEALKLADVSTFIASGNVLFAARESNTAALEARIERQLARALGYEVDTFLRTPAELTAVAAHRPFGDADMEAPGHTIHVAFLREAPGEEEARNLLSFRSEKDDFQVHGREYFWLVRGKTMESLVSWQRVGKLFRAKSTARNISTVRKLAAKFAV